MIYEKAADFKHILRILNTNIEGKQKLAFGLRGIKGVGRRFALMICKV
jgi:small subunit ribosomal protein S18e